MRFRLGLDLHGVCDAYPTFFSLLSKLFVDAGHEVFIITGPRDNEKTRSEVDACGIHFTSILSIMDYHIQKGTPSWQDEHGGYWIDRDVWNRTKAQLCLDHAIDFHIDDSMDYGEFFSIPYMQIVTKNKSENTPASLKMNKRDDAVYD
jgi:hypothetical protein